jgi:hypothetical protein
MRSTGEVMGVASTFGEAFAKAQLSAGQVLPTEGTVFFSVNDHDKSATTELVRRYVELGFKIVATEGTANVLEAAGMTVERVFKVKEGRESDPPGCGNGEDSDHYNHCRSAGRSRRDRVAAKEAEECLRPATTARGDVWLRSLG